MDNTENLKNGCIKTLVANGVFEADTKLKLVSYVNMTFNNINDTTVNILSKDYGMFDKILPKYLELKMTNQNFNDNTLEQIYSKLEKLSLKYVIDDIILQDIPLSLLINLNKPIFCDNKIYIQLCFFKELNMICIKQTINMILNISNSLKQYITGFSIICKATYLNTIERRQLYNSNVKLKDICNIFNEINYMNFCNINNSNTTYVFDINFYRISKGFFIKCDLLNKLSEIQLIVFLNTPRIVLNKFLIKQNCVTINPNLLYFPFNSEEKYYDDNIKSWEGAINFSRLDDVKLLLKFDEQIQNITIYNLSFNILRVNNKELYELVDYNTNVSGDFNYPTTKINKVCSNSWR